MKKLRDIVESSYQQANKGYISQRDNTEQQVRPSKDELAKRAKTSTNKERKQKSDERWAKIWANIEKNKK